MAVEEQFLAVHAQVLRLATAMLTFVRALPHFALPPAPTHVIQLLVQSTVLANQLLILAPLATITMPAHKQTLVKVGNAKEVMSNYVQLMISVMLLEHATRALVNVPTLLVVMA